MTNPRDDVSIGYRKGDPVQPLALTSRERRGCCCDALPANTALGHHGMNVTSGSGNTFFGERARDATIEECARIADETDPKAHDIGARIRALKSTEKAT